MITITVVASALEIAGATDFFFLGRIARWKMHRDLLDCYDALGRNASFDNIDVGVSMSTTTFYLFGTNSVPAYSEITAMATGYVIHSNDLKELRQIVEEHFGDNYLLQVDVIPGADGEGQADDPMLRH